MLIPAKYTLTPEISELLSGIEACREVIESVSIPPKVEMNIRRQSTLRSSLFSARIEGNDLTLEEVSESPSKIQKKAEVYNILKAINWLKERGKKDLKPSDILTLHQIAMEGLVEPSSLGKFRTNVEAIFNSAGIAIYLPPLPRQVPVHLDRLIKYINSPKERFVPVKAALAHYTFEKIHPFLDGSGRVGRLLVQKILYQGGYGMKGLLSIEEYLDNHRSEYYRALEEPEKDATDYLVFMLKAINATAEEAKSLILAKRELEASDYLLPRRAEILAIVSDQTMVNFDQIKRRFGSINVRTLRYDLKKLQDEGYIIKLGTTRGAYYKKSR